MSVCFYLELIHHLVASTALPPLIWFQNLNRKIISFCCTTPTGSTGSSERNALPPYTIPTIYLYHTIRHSTCWGSVAPSRIFREERMSHMSRTLSPFSQLQWDVRAVHVDQVLVVHLGHQLQKVVFTLYIENFICFPSVKWTALLSAIIYCS